MINKPLYTLQLFLNKKSKFYGPIHGSNDSNLTLCKKIITSKFWILTNKFDGIVTCKKCLKIIKGINK